MSNYENYDDDFEDGGCCPSCCRSPDLGVHDYCVPCITNPCCPRSSRQRSGWDSSSIPYPAPRQLEEQDVSDWNSSADDSKEERKATGEKGKEATKPPTSPKSREDTQASNGKGAKASEPVDKGTGKDMKKETGRDKKASDQGKRKATE